MPKYKTRTSAKLRFKVTKTGKVIHRTQGMRHLRRKKSKSRVRKYRKTHVLTGKFAKRIKMMLGKA